MTIFIPVIPASEPGSPIAVNKHRQPFQGIPEGNPRSKACGDDGGYISGGMSRECTSALARFCFSFGSLYREILLPGRTSKSVEPSWMMAPVRRAGCPLWPIGFTCPVTVCSFAIKELGESCCEEQRGATSPLGAVGTPTRCGDW